MRLLNLFLVTGKTPHALLFTGIEGIGKRTAALLFAQALNCSAGRPGSVPSSSEAEEPPCGQCPSCRRIQEGTHPDIITVNPRKGMLRIDQIRELIQLLSLKPFSAEHRVVILAEAHTLNAEAGNALLKILEEPPAGTSLILTAPQPLELLPTIASRCRHIRFNPLNTDDLAALLTAKAGLQLEEAQLPARSAEGSFTRALQMAGEDFRRRRDWIIRAAGLDCPQAARQRSAALALAFAGELAAHKERVGRDLELLKSWVRDLGIYPHRPARLIHQDRAEVLGGMRARLSDQQVTRLWEEVEGAQKAIAGNSNLRLTLDVMTLHMAEITAA